MKSEKQNQKFHAIEKVPKSNRKIVERVKIENPDTLMHFNKTIGGNERV